MSAMPHPWTCALAGLLLVFGNVRAIGAPQDPAPGGPVLSYRLSVTEPGHRELQVELRVSDLQGPLDLRMSRTSPGRYALHEFAKNVFDLTATDDEGRRLAVDHVEPNRWLITGHTGIVRVHYRV